MTKRFWNKIRPPIIDPRTESTNGSVWEVPKYPLNALETFEALPQIAFSPYPPDTMKALDSAILSKLRLLQFGLPFQESKFLVMNLLAAGFGASVPGLVSKGLVLAYLHDRTVLINDTRLIYDFCYEPVSIHHPEEIPREYTDSKISLEDSRNLQGFHSSKVVYVHRHTREELLAGFNSVAPLSLPLDDLYVRGLVLWNFLKLKQEYQAHIEEKRKEIGFKTPVIGVHIRHGDTLTNPDLWDRYLPVQTYLEVIKQVVNKTGISTVFVATDSEEVIRQLPENSGIDFIYDDKEIRYNTEMAKMLKDRPELGKQETLTAVKNIYLLADCDYLIATRGSWFRNSLAMSYFRKKKCTGILLQKRGETDCDINYLITGNNNLRQAATGALTDTAKMKSAASTV